MDSHTRFSRLRVALRILPALLFAMFAVGVVGSVEAVDDVARKNRDEPSVVRVQGTPGHFRLTRNGEDYFIKGVGGNRSPELLVRCGGNSFRTWGIDRATADFRTAREHGLTVTLGYWMGHERHGFNYNDPVQTNRQVEEVREMVRRYKDEPGLLIWALGNEIELQARNEDAAWKQVNRLAELVHQLDPNHPVMTVVAEISEDKLRRIERLCPAVDIIGVNAYGGAASLGQRWRQYQATKPYILTEFGPRGHWEAPKAPCGAPIEGSSTEKAAMYAKTYREAVSAEQGRSCLGSYAFLWGHKMETTPTWFGMLLPDGSKLAAAEAMEKAWQGTEYRAQNRVPEIEAIRVSKTEKLRPGETVEAKCRADDPDGDPLAWTWTLVAEVGSSVGGDAQDEAPEFPDAIAEGQGTPTVKLRLPGGGIYRLYAYVRDGKGNAAYSSAILQGEGEKPARRLPKPALPCAVYADEVAARWIPSGYMGNTGAIRMRPDCDDTPHSGASCLRVTYDAGDQWGGVLWQSPANDWGDLPGGYDLSAATMLEFWARGKNGGETVTFQVGGLEGKPFSDSFNVQKRELTLKKEWTRYRIALDGLDLSRVKTPFGWVVAAKGEPVTFDLDDIQFTAD